MVDATSKLDDCYAGQRPHVDTCTPVIVVTSQMLRTAVDVLTSRNFVLTRLVRSQFELKQIIGRGTRVRDDYGKPWFDIPPDTGTCMHRFADSAFDGDPAFATPEEISGDGKVNRSQATTPEEPNSAALATDRIPDAPLSPSTGKGDGVRCRMRLFDGGQVEFAAELVNQRARCVIGFPRAAAQAAKPDADPFDLRCHLAFNALVLTRRTNTPPTANSNSLCPMSRSPLLFHSTPT